MDRSILEIEIKELMKAGNEAQRSDRIVGRVIDRLVMVKNDPRIKSWLAPFARYAMLTPKILANRDKKYALRHSLLRKALLNRGDRI